MSASIVRYDRNSDLMRPIVRGLQMIKEGRQLLTEGRAVLIQTRDGDGSLSVHYDLTATLGGFQAGDYVDANGAAKAAFDEIDSLHAKLTTDESVSAVLAATDQACAKLGITT